MPADLVSERARAVETVVSLERELAAVVDASRESNADDEHDPEGQTIGYERAQLTALLASARDRVAALDDAMARAAEGTYGVCERCGRPIGAERLAALPATRRCVECAAAG